MSACIKTAEDCPLTLLPLQVPAKVSKTTPSAVEPKRSTPPPNKLAQWATASDQEMEMEIVSVSMFKLSGAGRLEVDPALRLQMHAWDFQSW